MSSSVVGRENAACNAPLTTRCKDRDDCTRLGLDAPQTNECLWCTRHSQALAQREGRLYSV